MACPQITRAGSAANHQNAHGEKPREHFANPIDDQANVAWHAFDKILPDKKHRLNCTHVSAGILKQQILMLETALQRFFHDLVVTMIFALILKRRWPYAAILQASQLRNLRYAVRKLDDIAVLHRNQPVWLAASDVDALQCRLWRLRVFCSCDVFHLEHAVADVHVALGKRKLDADFTKLLSDGKIEVAAITAWTIAHFTAP